MCSLDCVLGVEAVSSLRFFVAGFLAVDSSLSPGVKAFAEGLGVEGFDFFDMPVLPFPLPALDSIASDNAKGLAGFVSGCAMLVFMGGE